MARWKRDIPNPYIGRYICHTSAVFGENLVFRMDEKVNTHFKVSYPFDFVEINRGDLYKVKWKWEKDPRLRGHETYRRLVSMEYIPEDYAPNED